MKKLYTNKIAQKMIISFLLVMIIFNFICPVRSQALVDILFNKVKEGAMDLVKELFHLVTWVGDSIMNLLGNSMLGMEMGAGNLEQDDPNLTAEGSFVNPNGASNPIRKTFKDEELDGLIWMDWVIPNFIYNPETIFANKIEALDVNFINPGNYTSIADGVEDKSIIKQLQPIISSWYKSFRNISIVGLLSVLVYIGIRILIGSTAAEKAKYKERTRDWFMALCLVFVIHFIMSATLTITQSITSLFDDTVNRDIVVSVEDSAGTPKVEFKTNLIGYIRFQTQIDDMLQVIGFTVVYFMLVFITCLFTYIYLKRVLWMAFLTMIAPLVALTYPIDKVGDGKAQAFNLWLKEYTMNAMIQPVHLILYGALVGSAMELATNNIIYAVVAIAFLIPAEKFVKKMFRLDSAETPGSLTTAVTAAAAFKGLSGIGKKSATSNVNNKLNGKSEDDDTGRLNTVQATPTEEREEDNIRNIDDISGQPQTQDSPQELSSGDTSTPHYQEPPVEQPDTPESSLSQDEQEQLEQQRANNRLRQQRQQGRLGRVASNIGGRISDYGYRRGALGVASDIAGAGVNVAGKVAGLGMRATGSALAATATFAGSMLTGENAIAALAAGAYATKKGWDAGGNISDSIGNARKGIVGGAKEAYKGVNQGLQSVDWFTQDELNEKAANKFKKNEENLKFLRSMGENPKDFYEKPIVKDMINSGKVKDVKTMYNASKLVNTVGSDGQMVTKEAAIKAAERAESLEGLKTNVSGQESFINNRIREGASPEKAKAELDNIIKIQGSPKPATVRQVRNRSGRGSSSGGSSSGGNSSGGNSSGGNSSGGSSSRRSSSRGSSSGRSRRTRREPQSNSNRMQEVEKQRREQLEELKEWYQ